MGTIEKYLIAAIGFTGIVFLSSYILEPIYRVATLGILSILILSLEFYYTYLIGKSLYTLVLLLMHGGIIAMIFKIQHWPGAGPIYLLGNAVLLLFASVLTWNCFKQNRGGVSLLMTGVFLICHGICSVALNTELWEFRNVFYYALIGSITTVKLYDVKTEIAVDKILNIILIQSLLYVASDTANKWFA